MLKRRERIKKRRRRRRRRRRRMRRKRRTGSQALAAPQDGVAVETAAPLFDLSL